MKDLLIISLYLTLGVQGCLGGVQDIRPEPVSAFVQDIDAKIKEHLVAMLKTNDDDFYSVASMFVDAGGDERELQRYMCALAETGDPVAQFWLARYLLPTAVRDNTAAARAAELFQKSADQGYVPANIEYARLLGEGIGCKKNEKKAVSLLMDACKQGSQRARAAYLAFSGRLESGQYDSPEMTSELKKGNFYLEEMIAMRQNSQESAEHWLRSADSHGSSYAPFALSQIKLDNMTETEALACIKRSAERHCLEAMGLLGTLLFRSELVNESTRHIQVQKDTGIGLRLLLLAASQGENLAISTLAMNLAQGLMEGDDVAVRAYSLFLYAWKCGDPYAAAALGYCKVTGRGCNQDVKGGLEMLMEAHDTGSALWVNQALASLYFNGDGVSPDMQKAINYLGEDSAAGSIHAYAIMAAITALGNESCKPDEKKAQFYLQMAKEAGDDDAQAIYDAILEEGGWRYMPSLFK